MHIGCASDIGDADYISSNAQSRHWKRFCISISVWIYRSLHTSVHLLS